MSKRKKISKRLRELVLTGNPKCFYCGKRAYSIDHIVPVSNGGTNDDRNCVPCCGSCNSEKGTLSINEHRLRSFMKKKGLRPLNAAQIEFFRKSGVHVTLAALNHKFHGEK